MQFLCYALLSLMAWQGWAPDWIHYCQQNSSSVPQVSRHRVRMGTEILQSLINKVWFHQGTFIWFWQYIL